MRTLSVLLLLIVVSCGPARQPDLKNTVTVSIPPYAWFVKNITSGDFEVNIMVPAGADHHVYEPVPAQVMAIGRSKGYISNGLLSFEMTWLDRFYEANSQMAKLDLSEGLDLIEAGHESGHNHSHGEEGHSHGEGADPHYWLSPAVAKRIAVKTLDFIISLNPQGEARYRARYDSVLFLINKTERLADSLLSEYRGSSFMIFHPALGYIARDYGLNQYAVETEGKEPSPADLKRLIDISRENNIKVIFVQTGYDTKSAAAIAAETGAKVVTIDPMGEDWYESVTDIILKIHESLCESEKK
jgi:zinc transport system substrate-binding protein